MYMNTQLKTEFRSGDSQNKSGVVFPTMILCADSMHSHFKIQQKYPQACDIFDSCLKKRDERICYKYHIWRLTWLWLKNCTAMKWKGITKLFGLFEVSILEMQIWQKRIYIRLPKFSEVFVTKKYKVSRPNNI